MRTNKKTVEQKKNRNSQSADEYVGRPNKPSKRSLSFTPSVYRFSLPYGMCRLSRTIDFTCACPSKRKYSIELIFIPPIHIHHVFNKIVANTIEMYLDITRVWVGAVRKTLQTRWTLVTLCWDCVSMNPCNASCSELLLFKGFNAILVKPTIFNFWHSGTLALRTERESARMSKNKNSGLDQYGKV